MGLYRTRANGGARVVPLTWDQRLELLIGPRQVSAFASEEARREAWDQHADELMTRCETRATRPWAWWRYVAPEVPEGGDEARQLERLGVLSAAERELLAKWRALDAVRRATGNGRGGATISVS